MNIKEFNSLSRGDIVRHNSSADSLLVDGNYGTYVIATRNAVLDLLHREQWVLCQKASYDNNTVPPPLPLPTPIPEPEPLPNIPDFILPQWVGRVPMPPKDFVDWEVIDGIDFVGKNLDIKGKHNFIVVNPHVTKFNPDSNGGAISIENCYNFIIVNPHCTDNGNTWSNGDAVPEENTHDVHGIQIWGKCHNGWIIGGNSSNNRGDGLQINAWHGVPDDISHIYNIGTMYDGNTENGVDTKKAALVLLYDLTVKNHWHNSRVDGTNIVAGQEASKEVWVVKCNISDCNVGVRTNADEGLLATYVINNSFENILFYDNGRNAPDSTFAPGTAIRENYGTDIVVEHNAFDRVNKIMTGSYNGGTYNIVNNLAQNINEENASAYLIRIDKADTVHHVGNDYEFVPHNKILRLASNYVTVMQAGSAVVAPVTNSYKRYKELFVADLYGNELVTAGVRV